MEKSLRQRRERLKGKSEWNREAQAAVNKFIFWRDYGDPCIACGKEMPRPASDANHRAQNG
ncbi:recombination protein NinG [Pantoea agglomerans]|uniref:recombination protein NinG n=1 Tax=Enterobacter agglomerans TaxID=549 RepID=UPI001FCF1EA6|nr:recombination protein NinG [Pantoea agglomerans]WVL91305.1 recombination protein NinG [Pantoea agglomerans]